MYPALIEEYVRPQSVADALAAIARYEAGDAIFLAGGQSAMQAMKSRMLRPQCVVDLQAISELKGIVSDASGVRIGAMTRYVEIAASAELQGGFAALGDAARRVGDRQVRNRGTIGGSVCWNYAASCTPAVVLGLQGQLRLTSGDGASRSVAADDFFLGPLETARNDDEILLSVEWPLFVERSGSAYAKWGLVTDALPVIGVCVRVSLDADGRCESARVVLSGLANGATHVAAGDSLLLGCDGDADAIEAALKRIAQDTDTHSDMSADADYRRQLIVSIGRDVTATAFRRARGEA
jgi:aerobic carbon-monoxide dehydrogenase medium subunit